MRIELQNINYKKLHTELISAGLGVIELSNDAPNNSDIAPNATIHFADGTDKNLVQSIIDAHDPTPLPQPKSEVEKLKEENKTLKGEIATLQGAVDFIIMNY